MREKLANTPDKRSQPHTSSADRVLLLAPSQGLGGGIERYVETLEWAFAEKQVACHRVDLKRAGMRAHADMLAECKSILWASSGRTRIVVGHRALLPVATLLASDAHVCGVSLVCHGQEVWSGKSRPRAGAESMLMRRRNVRVVAASSFTAGSLARNCQATVLPPGLSMGWFDKLAAVGADASGPGQGIRLLTAFRLSSWRAKGLPQLVAAVTALGRHDVHLSICGSGDPSPDLIRLVAAHEWCTLRVGTSDDELARELSKADLFLLATRTRAGRYACGEGFGLVLLEAQVAGTAVVAPAHGGCRDAYIQGITGAAPTDETVHSLTSVLAEMLDDKGRLEQMGKYAAEWARQAFAPERYAEQVVRRLL
jgi:phosphatidyl-myo-inositol dimannoside synthase